MKDLHSNMKFVVRAVPAVRTASVNGSSIDRQGFDSVEHIASLGATGDTLSGSVKIDVSLQESDDDSTWSDVTEASHVVIGGDGVSTSTALPIIATIDDNAEDARHFRVGYIGGKRYSRLRLVFTGTHTNGIPCALYTVLGNAEQAPTSD